MAVLGVYLLLRPALPHLEIDRETYPVAGVDISAHNGRVDFDSLVAAGIDFVYIKASEGAGFRDSSFASNAVRAACAGLPVGAYHFFRFDCDGGRQARNLLEATDGFSLSLPMAIDVEEWGNDRDVDADTVVERLRNMAASLRAAGRRVIIYTNKNGYTRFVEPAFAKAGGAPDLWICSFTDPPLPRTRWTLWQHSHLARIPGIHGPVDMNTFNGTRGQFRRWIIR